MQTDVMNSETSDECFDETHYEDDITEVVGTLSEMSDDYPPFLSEDEDLEESKVEIRYY